MEVFHLKSGIKAVPKPVHISSGVCFDPDTEIPYLAFHHAPVPPGTISIRIMSDSYTSNVQTVPAYTGGSGCPTW